MKITTQARALASAFRELSSIYGRLDNHVEDRLWDLHGEEDVDDLLDVERKRLMSFATAKAIARASDGGNERLLDFFEEMLCCFQESLMELREHDKEEDRRFKMEAMRWTVDSPKKENSVSDEEYPLFHDDWDF